MRPTLCMMVVLLAAVLVCDDARAWSRSRDREVNVCLWWKNRTVTYFVNEICSADVPRTDCYAAVQAAFDTWMGHTCPDGNTADFRFDNGGTTPRQDVGYDPSKRNNINLVVWLESEWETHECPDPENEPICRDKQAIALTTSTFDSYTGQVVDSDIEMNGQHFIFTTSTPATEMDIHNTLAHEAGHVLGLDHSNNQDATMWETATKEETNKRYLTQDDIDGLCFLYPLGEPTPDYYLWGGKQIICRLDPPKDNCGCISQQPGSLILLLIGIGLLGHRTKLTGRQKS